MVGGRIVHGDGARAVQRVAPLHRAGPDELTFLSSAKYGDAFAATRAGVALLAPPLTDVAGPDDLVRIVVDRPHEALLAVLPALYRAPAREAGVHPTAKLGRGVHVGDDVTIGPYAIVGEGAVLGDRAWIEAHCVIGAGVEIGDDSRLFPHVTLYPGTTLGRRVAVHAGARIGSDGFGYVYADGAHQKIPHVGRCLVGDDVEIGANTTIDRGSIDDTVIGAGTKIDNLVHLGHNVRVGRLCLIMAQVGVAGSTVIEDAAILAGQAGLAGHVNIGKGARVAAQAGVFADVPAGATYSGYPARPHKESLRASAATFRVADLLKRIERMLERSERAEDGT
ncbi:MAG: UDP-3-O-(3-hydroxymyristoyl)glucosamine N-acyltransferase [Gemmatirosa sp.]|nr:UDP-3-O-(3-hydroxymyristoyl)glucosamine N-acyltransferase [Gemmatirosa sp.]